MKFTEEQYQKIVDLQKSSYSWSILEKFTDLSFWQGLIHVDEKLTEFIHENNLQEALAAIANPLTREWAHDNFVEKEKEFYWTSQKQDINGYFARLYKGGSEMVSSYSMMKPKNNINSDEQLTESEIKSWGFNPEMFDREEV